MRLFQRCTDQAAKRMQKTRQGDRHNKARHGDSKVAPRIGKAGDDKKPDQKRSIFSGISMRPLGFHHRPRRICRCAIGDGLGAPPRDRNPKAQQQGQNDQRRATKN